MFLQAHLRYANMMSVLNIDPPKDILVEAQLNKSESPPLLCINRYIPTHDHPFIDNNIRTHPNCTRQSWFLSQQFVHRPLGISSIGSFMHNIVVH